MHAGHLEVQVDGQTEVSWSKILTHFNDANIYQSWAYGAVRWGRSNLSHLVMRQKGKVRAAAQVRIVRIPFIPVGLAYVRWGPLCEARDVPVNPSITLDMMACLRDEYVKRRGFALHVIPNAFTGSERAAAVHAALNLAQFKPDPARGSYKTFLVDLSFPAEVIRKRLDQKWRNQLNSSQKNGLVFEVSDHLDAYREFLGLYQSMWERKRFDTSVDVNEFAIIHQQLTGPARMRTFIARKDGEAIGALVCSLMGDTAIYLLGATNEKAIQLKAANFLQWHTMLWLKENGAKWYDLGGINPVTNPGGYHFKKGFGGNEVVQLPSHITSGGLFGKAVIRGVSLLRRQRLSSNPPAQTSS